MTVEWQTLQKRVFCKHIAGGSVGGGEETDGHMVLPSAPALPHCLLWLWGNPTLLENPALEGRPHGAQGCWNKAPSVPFHSCARCLPSLYLLQGRTPRNKVCLELCLLSLFCSQNPRFGLHLCKK